MSGSSRVPNAEATLSSDELAAAIGITTARLARLVQLGLAEPVAPGANEFPAASAARLARVVRLRAAVGIRFVDASIILDLLERLDRLEVELARFRSAG